MLTITIPPFEIFDETTKEFITQDKEIKLKMENSLHAIAEWEAHYGKPYFNNEPVNPYNVKASKDKAKRTDEELRFFIKCMIVNYDIDEIEDEWLYGLTEANLRDINNYLQSSRSAFKGLSTEPKNAKKKRTIVAEYFYAWMAESQIPIEAEYWNINRLMNVIQIINDDNTPPDKKKKKKAFDQMAEWDRINEARKKALGTKG